MKQFNDLKMSYKLANDSDLKVLLEIEKEMTKYPLYHTFTENEFEKFLSNPQNKTFLLYFNNIVAGYCSFGIKSKDLVEIEGIAIIEEFRHKGLGTYAMNMLLEKLKQFKTIMLVTHPENNNSLRLYLKFGFRIKEWKDHYYGQ
jgi:ribosomal protein S18 acetylase RimI-like enzyme